MGRHQVDQRRDEPVARAIGEALGEWTGRARLRHEISRVDYKAAARGGGRFE